MLQFSSKKENLKDCPGNHNFKCYICGYDYKKENLEKKEENLKKEEEENLKKEKETLEKEKETLEKEKEILEKKEKETLRKKEEESLEKKEKKKSKLKLTYNKKNYPEVLTIDYQCITSDTQMIAKLVLDNIKTKYLPIVEYSKYFVGEIIFSWSEDYNSLPSIRGKEFKFYIYQKGFKYVWDYKKTFLWKNPNEIDMCAKQVIDIIQPILNGSLLERNRTKFTDNYCRSFGINHCYNVKSDPHTKKIINLVWDGIETDHPPIVERYALKQGWIDFSWGIRNSGSLPTLGHNSFGFIIGSKGFEYSWDFKPCVEFLWIEPDNVDVCVKQIIDVVQPILWGSLVDPIVKNGIYKKYMGFYHF